MCVSVITKQFKPNNKIVKGYKVIRVNQNDPKFTTSDTLFPIKMDQWLKAEADYGSCGKGPISRLTDNYGKVYPWGFHIWATRHAAKEWANFKLNWTKIVPVIGKDVRVVGKQKNFKLYVCKHLFVKTPKDTHSYVKEPKMY